MNLASWERAKASNVKILFNEHIIGIIGGLIQKHRLKIEPSFCYNKLNRSCSCSLLFFFISFVKNYGCFVNVYNCCCCSRCRFKCTLYIHISSLHKTRRERRKKNYSISKQSECKLEKQAQWCNSGTWEMAKGLIWLTELFHI